MSRIFGLLPCFSPLVIYLSVISASLICISRSSPPTLTLQRRTETTTPAAIFTFSYSTAENQPTSNPAMAPSSVASDDSANDVSTLIALSPTHYASSLTPTNHPPKLGQLHRRHRRDSSPRHRRRRHRQAQGKRLLHHRLGARGHAAQPAQDQGLQRDQGG
jgi:hypothetical protein